MGNKIIVKVEPDDYKSVIVEGGEIVEYHEEKRRQTHAVGDIYLARVVTVHPGLNAAFIEIGHLKEAFLHQSDLAPYLSLMEPWLLQAMERSHPPLMKRKLDGSKEKSSLTEIKKGQFLLVQILKEAISTKGLRLTTLISLTGRYLILFPFSGRRVYTSKKLSSQKERDRLQKLATSIKPPHFSITVRTAAEGQNRATLVADLRYLLDKWKKGVAQLHHAKSGKRLIASPNPISALLRDVLNQDFSQLVVDDLLTYQSLKAYLGSIAPNKVGIIHLYKGNEDLFKYLKIARRLKMLLGDQVVLTGGGGLVLQHTEAMHVIDVNSGTCHEDKATHKETILQVNLAACQEIARQLRLRDIGGLIVVDFISMKDPKELTQVYQAMQKAIKQDRSKIEVLPLSRFGLMEITRARVRPALQVDNSAKCPSCQGSGEICFSMTIVHQLEAQINLLILHQRLTKLTLVVHPFLYAYLTTGFWSIQWRWWWRYWQWVSIKKSEDYGIAEYKVFNQHQRLVVSNQHFVANRSI